MRLAAVCFLGRGFAPSSTAPLPSLALLAGCAQLVGIHDCESGDGGAIGDAQPDGGANAPIVWVKTVAQRTNAGANQSFVEKLELARRTFLANASEALVEAADYRDALVRVAALAVPRLAD